MRGGIEWTPRSSLQPWLQHCRVFKEHWRAEAGPAWAGKEESLQVGHGQGNKSLVWADFCGFSGTLQSEVGAVLCARGEWHPALPATLCSCKNPNRVWLLLGGRSRNGPALSHTAMSPCVPCPGIVLLAGHWGAIRELGTVHQYWNECSYCEVWVWLGKNYTEKQAKVSPCWGCPPSPVVQPSQLPLHSRFVAISVPEKCFGGRKEQSVPVIFAAAWQSWLCPCREGIWALGSQPPEAPCVHIMLLLLRFPEEFLFRWKPNGIYVKPHQVWADLGFPAHSLGAAAI